MTHQANEFKSDCRNLKVTPRKINASSKAVGVSLKLIENFLVFPFPVSHKIDLLNQMHNGNDTDLMNNQRTLEIIRDDLTSSMMVDTEGTFWDNQHPHLFVVMGASVSLI